MGLHWSWNDGWLLNMDEVLETDRPSFQDEFMNCKNGSQSFKEPEIGTSAYRNIGSAPKSGFSAQVNNGICGLASTSCTGSDDKRINCRNTCGGAVKESTSGNLSLEGLDPSANLDTNDDSEAIPNQGKKIVEDLVSKLKGVSQDFFSCWKSNFHNKVICMFNIVGMGSWGDNIVEMKRMCGSLFREVHRIGLPEEKADNSMPGCIISTNFSA